MTATRDCCLLFVCPTFIIVFLIFCPLLNLPLRFNIALFILFYYFRRSQYVRVFVVTDDYGVIRLHWNIVLASVEYFIKILFKI